MTTLYLNTVHSLDNITVTEKEWEQLKHKIDDNPTSVEEWVKFYQDKWKRDKANKSTITPKERELVEL
jgi:hypothetical protein